MPGRAIEWIDRRYLDVLGSIYIGNEHRGYTALDRAREVVGPGSPNEPALISADEALKGAAFAPTGTA